MFVACSDARAAGVSHLIKWYSGPCSQWEPQVTPETVVVNPPWGLRLLNDVEEEEQPAETDRWVAGDVHSWGTICFLQFYTRKAQPGYWLQPRLN